MDTLPVEIVGAIAVHLRPHDVALRLGAVSRSLRAACHDLLATTSFAREVLRRSGGGDCTHENMGRESLRVFPRTFVRELLLFAQHHQVQDHLNATTTTTTATTIAITTGKKKTTTVPKLCQALLNGRSTSHGSDYDDVSSRRIAPITRTDGPSLTFLGAFVSAAILSTDDKASRIWIAAGGYVLCHAVLGGDVDIVRTILSVPRFQRIDVLRYDWDWCLMRAVERGDVPMVGYLLDRYRRFLGLEERSAGVVLVDNVRPLQVALQRHVGGSEVSLFKMLLGSGIFSLGADAHGSLELISNVIRWGDEEIIATTLMNVPGACRAYAIDFEDVVRRRNEEDDGREEDEESEHEPSSSISRILRLLIEIIPPESLNNSALVFKIVDVAARMGDKDCIALLLQRCPRAEKDYPVLWHAIMGAAGCDDINE